MRSLMTTSAAALMAATVTLAASGALAADPPLIVEPYASAPGIVGYVDIHAGLGAGSQDGTWFSGDWSDEWTTRSYGGAGRVAIPLDPLTVQLDAWFNNYNHVGTHSWYSDYDYSEVTSGLAAHLAYALDGASLGGMVSVGIGDYEALTTAAVEAAATLGNMRLYGQLGSTFGEGYDDDEHFNFFYLHGVAAYYIDPNLAVSLNAGVSGGTWYDGDDSGGFDLGARIEKKFEDLPFSGYLQVQATNWEWDGEEGEDVGQGTSVAVMAGLRFAFGAETLQDLDAQVGLTDMNPEYGDLPH